MMAAHVQRRNNLALVFNKSSKPSGVMIYDLHVGKGGGLAKKTEFPDGFV